MQGPAGGRRDYRIVDEVKLDALHEAELAASRKK